MKMLNASDLLAGGDVTHQVTIPGNLLASQQDVSPSGVTLKPLTVKDLQLISRAAKDNDSLTSALMIQHAMVEPRLELAEVYRLPVGLMEFLLTQVNRISGIGLQETDLQTAAEDPLLRAAFLLAQEFGWTPEQVSDLTLGQLMLNLQMLKERAANS